MLVELDKEEERVGPLCALAPLDGEPCPLEAVNQLRMLVAQLLTALGLDALVGREAAHGRVVVRVEREDEDKVGIGVHLASAGVGGGGRRRERGGRDAAGTAADDDEGGGAIHRAWARSVSLSLPWSAVELRVRGKAQGCSGGLYRTRAEKSKGARQDTEMRD